jgi:hypothetical protein
MRINEKGTLGGMIDTEMWENRMNLEIHECGNASVEREWWNASGQGGKRKAKWRLAKVMNGRRVGHTRVTLMETKKMRWRARNMWAFFKNETENGHERTRDNGNTRIIMPMN